MKILENTIALLVDIKEYFKYRLSNIKVFKKKKKDVTIFKDDNINKNYQIKYNLKRDFKIFLLIILISIIFTFINGFNKKIITINDKKIESINIYYYAKDDSSYVKKMTIDKSSDINKISNCFNRLKKVTTKDKIDSINDSNIISNSDISNEGKLLFAFEYKNKKKDSKVILFDNTNVEIFKSKNDKDKNNKDKDKEQKKQSKSYEINSKENENTIRDINNVWYLLNYKIDNVDINEVNILIDK